MISIILSTGKSSRFGEAGFTRQKSMLPMPDGRTLLEWQLERIPCTNIVYASRKEYYKDEANVVHNIMFGGKYPGFKQQWIEKDMTSPLDAVYELKRWLRTDEEVLITYNDELLTRKAYQKFVHACRQLDWEAGLVCFDTPDERYTDVPGTPYKCGCTYYFRTGKSIVRRIKTMDRATDDKGVPDLVYSFGADWIHYYLEEDDFAELGTAKEYKLWAAQNGMVAEDFGF